MFTGVSKRYYEALAEPKFNKRESFYLFGDAGRGKTHLACSIINIDVKEKGMSEIRLVNVPKLIMEYRNADFEYKQKIISEFSAGLMIFDDLGAEYQSEFSQEFIFMIIENRWNRMPWTGFTSNLSINELPYSDRIKSRIKGVVGDNVHEITGKDKRI